MLKLVQFENSRFLPVSSDGNVTGNVDVPRDQVFGGISREKWCNYLSQRVCCKEIPLDAAFTPEGAEYVEHFCGLECYQRFEARAKTGNETDADPNACDSLPSD